MQYSNGQRVIASFEAIKGIAILLLGFGLLSLIHQDIPYVIENLIGDLDLNPASKLVRVIVAQSSNFTDHRLVLFALLCYAYAGLRLSEAFGLWYGKHWAEWLAIGSGGIYLPLEMYELIRRVTWMRVSALVANLIVVVAIALVLWRNKRVANQA